VALAKETEVLGLKPVPVQLCPPQIPHGQASKGDASGQLPKTRNSLSSYFKQPVFLFQTQFDFEFKMQFFFSHVLPK